jgi:hypothetical protein
MSVGRKYSVDGVGALASLRNSQMGEQRDSYCERSQKMEAVYLLYERMFYERSDYIQSVF